MSKIFFTAVVTGILCTTCAWADGTIAQERADIHQDTKEIRQDRQEIRQDIKEHIENKQELREAR